MEKLREILGGGNITKYILFTDSRELREILDLAKEGKSELALGILLGSLQKEGSNH